MISDDDLLKANVSSGPEVPEEHVRSQEELLKNLNASIDLLTEAILYTLNDTVNEQNNLLSQLINKDSVHDTVESFEQTRPRNEKVTPEAFGPVFEDQKRSIIDAIQRGFLGAFEIAGHAVSVGAGPIGYVGGVYAGGIAGNAAQALGIQNPQVQSLFNTGVNNAINSVTQLGSAITTTIGGFTSFSSALTIAVTGLAAFGTALSGAGLALGLFEGFGAYNRNIEYQKMGFRTDPNSVGVFDPTSGVGFNQAHQNLKSQMIGGRGDDDIQRLRQTALSMRPGAEGIYQNVDRMAVTVGYLEDYGVAQETTGRLGYSMMKDLQLNYQQTDTALRVLADTAKQHGIELSTYMEKVVELSKKFRGLGVDIKDVNGVFNKFMNETYAGGAKLTAAEALGATEIALGAPGQLNPGAAAWIAMTTASHIIPGQDFKGRGFFQGTGDSFGELMKQGPIGAYLAQTYVRAGMGGTGAIFESVKQMTDRALMMAGEKIDPKSKRYHDLSMAFADPILKSYGIEGGNISDPKYQALLASIAKGKLTEDELQKAREKFRARTPTDIYNELVKQTNMLDPIAKLWAQIRDLLAQTFLPLIQGGMLWLGTIGKFVLSWGQKGIWGFGAAAEEAEGFHLQNQRVMYEQNMKGLRSYYQTYDEESKTWTDKAVPTALGRMTGVWNPDYLAQEEEAAKKAQLKELLTIKNPDSEQPNAINSDIKGVKVSGLIGAIANLTGLGRPVLHNNLLKDDDDLKEEYINVTEKGVSQAIQKNKNELGDKLKESHKSALEEWFQVIAGDIQLMLMQSGSGAVNYTGVSGAIPNKVEADDMARLLIAKGYTPEAAAAIVANAYKESGFNTAAVGDSGKSEGLFQWQGSRQTAIEKRFGKDLKTMSLSEQVDAFDWEVKNYYKSLHQELTTPGKDSGYLAAKITKDFERPANVAHEMQVRAGYAQDYYRKLVNGDLTINIYGQKNTPPKDNNPKAQEKKEAIVSGLPRGK